MLEKLGQEIRRRRRLLGLTQQEVADLAGVGRRTVIDLEAGRDGVSLGRADTVCGILGLTLVTAERHHG